MNIAFCGLGIGFHWGWGWTHFPNADDFDFILFVGPIQILWVEI